MKAISIDMRERILTTYDRGQATRMQVAKRFCVSEGLVKRLLSQRKKTGEIDIRYSRCGRKPLLKKQHGPALRALLAAKPDLTLHQQRAALGLKCSLQAIHYVLQSMGLTYKKRLSEPASRIARTSREHGGVGNDSREASSRRASYSSTNRRRKQT